VLIHIARPMYANESLGFDLDNTVYALVLLTSQVVRFYSQVICPLCFLSP